MGNMEFKKKFIDKIIELDLNFVEVECHTATTNFAILGNNIIRYVENRHNKEVYYYLNEKEVCTLTFKEHKDLLEILNKNKMSIEDFMNIKIC
jgi:uncharacterized protein YggL (DUF469 family)